MKRFQKNARSSLVLFFAFSALIASTEAPARAQSEYGLSSVNLSCSNSFKAAKHSGLKKRDLPKFSSCTFQFQVSVRTHPVDGAEQIFLGTANLDLFSQKGDAKFRGTAAQAFAASLQFFTNPDTGEQITPENAELVTFNYSQASAYGPGGAFTNNGVTCSATEVTNDITFSVPYLPGANGLIDLQPILVLDQQLHYVCRRA